jgi:transposase
MALVKELIQQHIGSGPILKALIQKMGFIPIIDRNLPADPRRVGPTHGEAVAGMVACLIQGICALYRIEQFAVEDPVLRTLFPRYDAKAWHDDHLGDTLDAIWEFGPGALQGAVTAHLLDSFGIRVDQIHYDTTSFKVFGRYEAADETAAAEESGEDVPRDDPATARTPVRLVPGHSKDHRPDLNQVKGGLAVSADGGVPVLWQAQDGNRADVSTYVEYWLKVKDVVGRSDFLFVGDCKLATQDNLVTIIQQQGRFLAPLPAYAGMQRQLEEWVLTNTVEDLLPRREASGKEVWYRGFRRPYTLGASAGQQCPCEVHILCNPRLQAEKQMHLERRLQRTQVFLEGLPKRLGKRALKSREAIAQALEATLKRYHTGDLLTYRIVATETTRKQYRGRGRPGTGAFYEEVSEVHWTVEWQWLPDLIDKAKLLGGYFPLITNDSTLTTARALSIYKEQYHPEQRFRWLKGAGILAPVLLKQSHRIEAFFFVVGLVLQLLTLVEREAAHQIAASGKPIIGLKPNRLPDYRPKTEALLNIFRHVTVTQVILAEHPAEIVISPLNLLQTRVLRLMGLEESIYTLDYLSRPLDDLDAS